MKIQEKIKMFNDVFAPKPNEKILFLYDIPHDNIKDNEIWRNRRKMVEEWFKIFQNMSKKIGFFVTILEFKATGIQNTPIPNKLLDILSKYNLIIAMTEFSISSSLLRICKENELTARIASMPYVEKRMEKSAFKADYRDVKRYAINIEKILNKTIGAKVVFSTGDELYIDLRNRVAQSDRGDCTKPGQFINFPSGEGFKSPYEALPDEIDRFGKSKTEGFWPIDYLGEIVRYRVKNNRIVEIIGDGKNAKIMRDFFKEKPSRGNVAELGIGCNPSAVVSGNPLEDEKVGGLHIAYGMSTHIGGKITSDIHLDISYPKGAPIEAKTLTLYRTDGSTLDLIKNSLLQYRLIDAPID